MGEDATQGAALALFDEGRTAALRGDHALAVVKLRASVGLAPTATSLAALGLSLSRLSLHSEAVVSLAAAIGLGDAAFDLRARLAAAIADAGDRPEGLRRLWELQRERPNDLDVRFELRRVLLDPVALARIANRRRLLDEIRVALPEVRIAESDTWIEGLAKVGRYISAQGPLVTDRRFEPAFRFLDRLAASPDAEVADLLTSVVFPAFSQWSTPVEAARAMLSGRARRALDDALALWGPPPSSGSRPLAGKDLRESLEFRLPGFALPETSSITVGAALGRHFVSSVEACASELELQGICVTLCEMAESDDSPVNEAFADALAEIIRLGSTEALRTAHRTLSGLARVALENLAGRDQLSDS